MLFLVNLFDSKTIKEDLNWSKISFKDTDNSAQLPSSDGPTWIKDKLDESKNNVYGVS